MSQFSTPEGYVPYRLFTYTDYDRECTLRPELFAGSLVQKVWNDRFNEAEWKVHIILKDGDVPISMNFGSPSFGDAENMARAFNSRLVAFMEQDALRNAHNAVMRKGKSNGG